jgi:hypothetical protein
MDLMDRGNLAAAVRHGQMFVDDDGSLNAVSCQQSAAACAFPDVLLHHLIGPWIFYNVMAVILGEHMLSIWHVHAAMWL